MAASQQLELIPTLKLRVEAGRLERAQDLQVETLGPGLYRVQSGSVARVVDLTLSVPCACGDQQHHGRQACKHTLAAMLAAGLRLKADRRASAAYFDEARFEVVGKGGNSYNGFPWPERAKRGAERRQWVRDGRLGPPLFPYTRCVCCGVKSTLIDAHAEDYTPPYHPDLDIPVCFRCHMMIHIRLRYPNQWDLYRELVREGWRFKPFASRNFPVLMVEVATSFRNVKKVQGLPPVRKWLDEIHDGKLCPPGRVPGNAPPEKR